MNVFTKIPEAWREVIYYILVIVMIAAIVFDVVTADQVVSILDKVAMAISALGFLMAGANTNGTNNGGN